LNRKWKVEVGEGYGTPIVVGDVVYAFTRRSGNETLTALSVADGTIRWATGYPAPFEISAAAKVHGPGPKATPLYHRGKLYTLGVSGLLTAFDVQDGRLVWQTAPPAEQPYFGMAASPVGYNNLVIAHAGNYGSLAAFDAETGAVRWNAGGPGTFASPMVANFGGVPQVVSITGEGVVGVSLDNGRVLWQQALSSRDVQVITPLITRDRIIISGHNYGVSAFRPVRRDGKWATEVLWHTKEVSMFLSNPVLVGDTLYGLSHLARGRYFSLDVTSGKVLWLGDPRAATNTAIVKADDLLFLLNDDGELLVAKHRPSGIEPLYSHTVADNATWAQPAISGDRIFVKDVSMLALWTFQ
jgi:outer membrane protein assembly factor BamB